MAYLVLYESALGYALFSTEEAAVIDSPAVQVCSSAPDHAYECAMLFKYSTHGLISAMVCLNCCWLLLFEIS